MINLKKEKDLNTQSVLAMRGSGYYSQRTAGAKIAIDSMQPILEKALKEIPKQPILFGSIRGCFDRSSNAP